MGTKKMRIYGKGAPFKGAPQRFAGDSCPKLPPPWIRHWCETNILLVSMQMWRFILGF